MFSPSPISPTRSTIPIPQFDASPGVTPPRCLSFVNGASPRTNKKFLPTLPLNGTVPRIKAETLAMLLSGDYDEHYDSLFILDCRYQYEYDGGHIQGACHIDSPDSFQEMFFDNVVPNSVVIFHCEFSHNRGPQMASIFREIDRNLNKMEYPNLFYPDVYILDGGYRNFYQEYPDFCDGGYTRMLDDSHRSNGDLIKETSKYKKNVQKLDEKKKKHLVTLPAYSSKIDLLQSPVACDQRNQSPIVSKMLNFFTSPIAPRRI